MTTYEYQVVTLTLTEQQKQVIQMGLANIDEVNAILTKVINEQAKDGWEPLYPFSVPAVWFRRIKQSQKKSRRNSQ